LERLGQAREALADRLLDRLRKRVARERRGARERERARLVLRETARLEERADELAREERVPLRRLVEAVGELVRELPAAGRELDERAALGRGERARRDRGEAWIAGEGIEHPRERVALVDLRPPVRADDEQRRRREAAHDVLERLER